MSRTNWSMTVACPKCGAPPDVNCTTRDGRITATHRERVQASR